MHIMHARRFFDSAALRVFAMVAVACLGITPQCHGSARLTSHHDGASGRDEIRDLRTFQKLRRRLADPIRKNERDQIYFSLGEYYFTYNVMADAQQTFEEYLLGGPDSIGQLIANVYLYKIAGRAKKGERQQQIRKEVFKRQFVLLFDKYKTLRYRSLFGNEYEVRYFVDRIDVLLNGDMFEQITP